MDTEKTLLQKLMNSAYAKLKGEEWTEDQFHAHLSAPELFAVRVGNLNYQVENGGFVQWRGNDYATPATLNYLWNELEKVGPVALEVRKLLGRFKAITKSTDDDEDLEEEKSERLDELDDVYYKINDQFMQECEVYVSELQQCDLPDYPATIFKLDRMLRTLFDAHYGTAYHHCGDGDGLTEEQAREIVEYIKSKA